MKNFSKIAVRISVWSVVVILIVFRVFFFNQQSTAEEMKKAFAEASVKVKNTNNTDPKSWKLTIWQDQIRYQQVPENSLDKITEHSEIVTFYLNKDSSKVVMDCCESMFKQEGTWLTAGNAYQKYREFRNAADFSREINSLLRKTAKKKSPLDITNFYPAITWKNTLLSFHDNHKDNEYRE